MPLEELLASPFGQDVPMYDESCLSFGRQPEYSTGDVLLASCYRALRLVKATDADVDLQKIHVLPEQLPEHDREAWKFLLGGALRSPTKRGEGFAGNPLPQVVPLVPSLAAFTGVIGAVRSRWNAGLLVMFALASGVGLEQYPMAARALAEALSVQGNDDDCFAEFLDSQLAQIAGRQEVGASWSEPQLEQQRVAYRIERSGRPTPAETFARDLLALLDLKPRLTRREFCALVESLLRLGVASHVLWICRLNVFAWERIKAICDGARPPSPAQVRDEVARLHAGAGSFLAIGQSAEPSIRRQIEAYVGSQLGIRCIFSMLGEAAVALTSGTPVTDQLSRMFELVGANRLICSAWREPYAKILETQHRAMAGRSGPPRNLYFFLSYSLRRRQTKEEHLEHYDQSYLLAKAASSRNSPWIVRPGPVLIMLAAHLTCRQYVGAQPSLQDLADHFGDYGVRVTVGSLEDGPLAADMQDLGILVDSPDAGGGRVVRDPFK